MSVLHHVHLRKRRTRPGLEPFPARSAWKRLLDRVIYAAGIIGPIMTIPQILKIYGEQNASGLSPISWGAWTLLNIPWILYGLAHRERPIIITYTLWFFCNSAVFIGAMLYGSGF
ncbi:MAG TPA: PQ-loop repeat-containing protein [Candidatus Paceibacterota bacterium]